MFLYFLFFFFKQKTAYEMRISDWSSDVCSSDLLGEHRDDSLVRQEHDRDEMEVEIEEREILEGAGNGKADQGNLAHARQVAGPVQIGALCGQSDGAAAHAPHREQ